LLLVTRDVFWQSFWRRIVFRAERGAQVLYRRKPWTWALQRPTLDGRLFCYHEPFTAFCIDQLANHFTNTKLIHIIRDGRDNADSMVRSYPDALSNEVLGSYELCMRKNSEIGVPRPVGKRFVPWWVAEEHEGQFLESSQYGRYVWMWREMVSRIQECGQRLGATRYLEVRYEEVVREAQSSAAKIIGFLGFQPSRALHRKLRKGRATSIGISARNQSPERRAEATAVAGTLLNRLGYAGAE
jgi:hypothetical protein